jgi:hypothetical protein
VNKLFSLAAAVSISFFCVAAAQSMPLAPLEQAQAGLTIPVAGGCGPGFHRGPYGGCRRNGYYGGVYYGAPVVAPGVVVAPGPCGGRGTHRVCNPYRCWRVCN